MTDLALVEDSISDDIRNAMKPAEAPAAEASAPAAAEPAAAPEPAETDEKTPARAPDGKFVAKPAEPAQQSTPDQPIAAPAEASEPIRPPAAWSAQAKSDFAALPPHIQAEVVKRERDMDTGLAERANRLKSYEPLDQVLAPYREKFAIRGITPHQGVQQLLAAQDMLDRDPLGGLAELARSYGVHPMQIAQALGQAPQQAQPSPELKPILDELSALKQTLSETRSADAQRKQAEDEASQSAIRQQIETFSSDPKHMYFDNVQDEMGVLIQAGKAKDLAQAYDMACWASPEIRPLLLAEQDRTKALEADKRAKDARQAAGSVTGAPGPGAVAPETTRQNASVEDDLRDAFRETSSRA